jgi:hypothetical protein
MRWGFVWFCGFDCRPGCFRSLDFVSIIGTLEQEAGNEFRLIRRAFRRSGSGRLCPARLAKTQGRISTAGMTKSECKSVCHFVFSI